MGITYNTSVVRSGLVLHLDAANAKSYPSSGTVWTDLSGQGNTGTLTNGPTYSSANGGSLVFDGSNDYVELTGNILLGSSFTLSMIFKQTGTRSDWVRLFGHSNDSLDRFWGIWMPTTSNYLLWQSYKNGGSITTPTYNFNLNQTYVVDMTCSTATKTFYINGEFYHSAVSGGDIDYTGNTSKIRIGYAGFHTYYLGNFYSARIYNRVLSATEIQQNFQALRDRYGI